MPFLNEDRSCEIWIQSARIKRHIEELKSSVNHSGRPIVTIGVAGHRGDRFQLGISKSLYPRGVTILARDNVQPGLTRIDLQADVVHTHSSLDKSVHHWYHPSWIVERTDWSFGHIDTLVLAFPPPLKTDTNTRSLGHILIYRFAAVDEREWKVFSSHDQLLERFGRMALDTPVPKKPEHFTPTTLDTPVSKKREESIEQPSLAIAPPRLVDPKPFYSRRSESAVAPTPEPEPELPEPSELQVQEHHAAQQVEPDGHRLMQPALASAPDGQELAAAPAARQATPASPDGQHDDVRIIEVIRRPNKVGDDKDDLEVRPETSESQIAPRKKLTARRIETQATPAPSSDHIDDDPIPEGIERPAADHEDDVEGSEALEQPAPSNEAAPAPSIGDETPMDLSRDDDDDLELVVPPKPQERVSQQETVAERPSDKQVSAALSSDEDDDDAPLAPTVERRRDESIVVDDVLVARVGRRTDEAIVVDDIPIPPVVERSTDGAIVVDDIPMASSAVQRTDEVILVDEDDDEELPPVAQRRRSTSRRTAAARRADGSSPPPFSSDRANDDAEYRPNVSPSRTTVDQPLLNLDLLFLEDAPRRSGRLLERQRHQLEKARQKQLEEQERLRKAAPRRPQYSLQAHGLLKALWTRPVHSVRMVRTWPIRVANNGQVMDKLRDHLECIDDDEEERGGRDPDSEDWRAPENGVASELWHLFRQITGDNTRQDSPHSETGMMEDNDEETIPARPKGLLTQVTPQQRSPERRSPAKAAQKGSQRKGSERKSSPSITIARLVLPNHGNISFTKLELQRAWLATIAEERALEMCLEKRRKRWEKVYKICMLHKAYMPFL